MFSKAKRFEPLGKSICYFKLEIVREKALFFLNGLIAVTINALFLQL